MRPDAAVKAAQIARRISPPRDEVLFFRAVERFGQLLPRHLERFRFHLHVLPRAGGETEQQRGAHNDYQRFFHSISPPSQKRLAESENIT